MDDLGRYSKVYRRIWRDEDFRRLTDNGKLLFLRLMTGPELGSIPGLLAAREAGLADDLGWSLERFREPFGELSGKPFARADWGAGLVWLPRGIRYNRPDNPNVVFGWRKEWPEVPECALKWEAFRDLWGFVAGLGEPYAKAFREGLGEPSGNGMPNQEQEQEQDQEESSATPQAGTPAPSPPAVRVTVQEKDGTRREVAAKTPTAPSLAPYLDAYLEEINARRGECGESAVALADIAADKDTGAIGKYLKRKKWPPVETWRVRVREWVADAWTAENGLLRLRDFQGWHQRRTLAMRGAGGSLDGWDR